MRIIAGEYRRRRFDVPKTFNARPTTDFAKENLFNVLTNNYLDIEGIRALDLFSGTGGITFELLSRGACEVWSVEARREHAVFIRRTAEKLGCTDRLRLSVSDVFRFVAKYQAKPFDFIFADPPYRMEEIPKLPEIVCQSHLLSEDGLFVLEHPGQYQFSDYPTFVDHREYGSVNFSFFRLGRAEQEEIERKIQ